MRKHVYHINSELHLPKNFIVCGRRARVDKISSEFLKDVKIVNDGDYYVKVGMYKDMSVGVATTGIGAASASIAMQELVTLGARNVIRVGTCGKLRNHLKSGDICLVYAAVRNDGVTDKFAPLSYPAVVDPFLMEALLWSARENGGVHNIFEKAPEDNAVYACVADTKADFFLEVPISADPEKTRKEWESLIRMGVAASSMECAVLMTRAALLQAMLNEPVRAASLLVVVGEALSDTLYYSGDRERQLAAEGEKKAAKIALDALYKLHDL
ncbi:MAG: hypothetical protein QXL15_04460 [Candidatus Korarchaeota archaeon]